MKVLKILFKQNRFLNSLNIFVAILFFTLTFVLVINLNQTKIEIDIAKNFEGKNLYQLTDQLFGDKETAFFSTDQGFKILNKFNNTLSSEPRFAYYTATWQPIGVADFKGDSSFDPNYENGTTTSTHEYNNKLFSAVKAIFISEEVINLNHLQIDQGRAFNKEEYTYKENTKAVPVLLGSGYRGTYHLGDTMHIFIYLKELECQVVGFLDSSQKIMTANQPEVILDNYILLPTLKFSDGLVDSLLRNPDNKLFIKASLLAKANSLILSESSPLEIRNILDEIAVSTGFRDFQVIGANSMAMNALVSMTKANILNIYILAVVLFVTTLLTFFYTLSLKTKRNVDTFIVMLISGANMRHIQKHVRNEFLLMSVIGVVIPILPFFYITGGSFSSLAMYLIGSLIIVLALTLLIGQYIKKIFADLNIVQRLKG